MAGESHQDAIATHLGLTSYAKQLETLALHQAVVLARIERRLDHVTRERPSDGMPELSGRMPELAGMRAAEELEPRQIHARLTVIVSTYNQDRYIADALDSVLAQRTSFRTHALVADDASTDPTLEIVEQYRARRPDLITVLRSEQNRWYFTNVLRALALIRSDYFTLLDADDYWIDEQYLQRVDEQYLQRGFASSKVNPTS